KKNSSIHNHFQLTAKAVFLKEIQVFKILQDYSRFEIITIGFNKAKYKIFDKLRLKRNIDNWKKSIDSLDKAVKSWTKCVGAGKATICIRMIWKGNKMWWSDSLSLLRKIRAAKQLRKKLQLEKHQHMKFIHTIQGIKHQYEKHYDIVEDYIKCKIAISKPLELDDNFIGLSDIHQSDITKEENGGNAMIKLLVFLFGWSFRMGYTYCMEEGNIVHIPKPDGDHSHHKPIALLLSVGKLMERIITKRLILEFIKDLLYHQYCSYCTLMIYQQSSINTFNADDVALWTLICTYDIDEMNELLQQNLDEYLELFIDSHMTYSKLGYLTYLCLYKGARPSLSTYSLLYKTIIRPSFEYASAFWNGAADIHKRRLERIQRIAMCRIFSVMNQAAYDTVNAISQLHHLEL
ncbi:hypothetical protein RFI_02967, partial [Reticulomyxa filosa]